MDTAMARRYRGAMSPNHLFMSTPLLSWPRSALVAAALALAPACTLNTQGQLTETTGAGGATASSGTSSSSGVMSTGGMTGTGGVMATGGMGGMGGTPVEQNCLDQADNDKDGFPDCADSDCMATHSCVGNAPSGWTGPVRIHQFAYSSSSQDVVATCSDGSMAMRFYGGPASAQCTPCNCLWVGAKCSAPQLWCGGNSNCNGAPAYVANAQDSMCTALGLPYLGSSTYCQITSQGTVTNGGTCNATGGAVTGDMWTDEVQVCPVKAGGGGCSGSQSCGENGSGDFAGNVCIYKAGTDTCPSGWKAKQLQVYQDGKDDRSCSQCGCAEPASCQQNTGSYVLFNDLLCAGNVSKTVSFNNGCVGIGGVWSGVSRSLKPFAATVVNKVACNGGVGAGQVITSGATKICCR